MSRLRRHYVSGHAYFVTLVTFERRELLLRYVDVVVASYIHTRRAHRFRVLAWAILPDHLHAIVVPGKNDLSELVHRFKMKFTGKLRISAPPVFGRVWQHRFWDHAIRDDADLERHMRYIHFNPVKHMLSADQGDYPYSSFKRLVGRGIAPAEKPGDNEFGDEDSFGE